MTRDFRKRVLHGAVFVLMDLWERWGLLFFALVSQKPEWENSDANVLGLVC